MVKVEYEKSEYEQERDARIARNEAFMRSLGLGGGLAGPEEPKKPKKPRKKRPRGSEPREGSRKSGRIAGEIAPGFEDANAIALALAEADPNTSTVRLFRVPRGKRIHAQRSAELDSICTETNQLTAAEAAAAAAARAAFEDSNWKPESAAREGLAAVPGIRRPAWLDSLENSAILSSKPQAHVDKVMIVLERLAAGCGIGLPGWPDRARLCDAAQRPLTLGTDIEMLKYCGKRLETVHGEDTSNGWAYTHALGKLKAYQGMLMGDDVFSEESLADLDDAVLEFIVADAIKPLSLKPMTPEERAGPTSPEDDAAIAAALAEGARGTRSSTRTRTPTTKASEGDGGEEEEEEEEESSDDDDDDDDDGDEAATDEEAEAEARGVAPGKDAAPDGDEDLEGEPEAEPESDGEDKVPVYCALGLGLPPEYVEFDPDYDKCAEWIKKHCPHLLTDAGDDGDDDGDGKKKSRKRGGGVVKKKVLAEDKQKVIISKEVRNKKKAVTTVEGLETFGVKLKDAAKVFGKKFAASSSVKGKDTGGEEIVIQGDVIWDLPALLEKEYKIPKAKIWEKEKGGKLTKVR